MAKVKCQNCGFVGLVPVSPEFVYNPLVDISCRAIEEIPPHWRGTPKYISAENNPVMLGCYRLQFGRLKCFTLDHGERLSDEAISMLINPAKCTRYFEYNPGYTPMEHRDLQRENQNRRLIFISSLISAIIGAIFGGLIATVANLLWKPPA